MFPELDEIKKMRRQLGLTQHALAKRAGISQSLIAKIESGRMDPTYTRARRIFLAIDELMHGKRLKAADIMSRKIISARPRERIKVLIATMRKHGISQLPVLDHKELVGYVSERTLLQSMLDGKRTSVEEVMSERPPSVALDTPVDVVSRLLMHYPLVAVFTRSKMVGIITKADILAKVQA